MQKLIVTRGIPGCGKSTWVKEHGLDTYTLCPDDIRMMCSEPTVDFKGVLTINQDNDPFVWKILKEMLEFRLKHNYLTCIDATCSRIKDMRWYEELANKYHYELIVVDFTSIPLDTCKERNYQRESYKWVPEEVLELYDKRFKSQEKQIPSTIKVLKYDDKEFDDYFQKFSLDIIKKLDM